MSPQMEVPAWLVLPALLDLPNPPVKATPVLNCKYSKQLLFAAIFAPIRTGRVSLSPGHLSTASNSSPGMGELLGFQLVPCGMMAPVEVKAALRDLQGPEGPRRAPGLLLAIGET